MNKIIKKLNSTIFYLLTILSVISLISSCQYKTTIDSLNNMPRDYDKQTLFFALNMNNFEYIKEIIADGEDINIVNVSLPTPIEKRPLTVTLEKNGGDIVAKYLLECGADVNYLDSNGFSLLMYGSGINSYEVAPTISNELYNIILKQTSDINQKDKNGFTALDHAIKNGNSEKVLVLLSNGATISNNTAKAIEFIKKYDSYVYNYELSRVVLQFAEKQGAALEVDPIFKAAVLGRSEEVINLIDIENLDVNSKEEIIFGAAAFCDVNTIKKLLNSGFNVNALDKSGRNLLNIAATYGNLENFKYFIELGLSEKIGSGNRTVLDVALENNQFEIAQYLFGKGSKLNLNNIKPNDNWVVFNNPIDDVIKNNNFQMLDLLIENGYLLIEETITHAINKSIEFHKMDMLIFFLDKNIELNKINSSSQTFLTTACKYQNIDAARLFIEKGVDINGSKSSTPLLQAVSKGHLELVKLLISKQVDVNKIDEYTDNSKSDTALMTATQKGYFDIVKILVENGANLDTIHWDISDTALLETSKTSNNILEYLIEKGANINYQNKVGNTALTIATYSQNLKNVQSLINAGADVNLKNGEGLAAIDIAKKQGDQKIEELLKSNR